jgi:hypothetical protein
MGELISIFDFESPFVHIFPFWTIFWGPLFSWPGIAMFEVIVVSVSAYMSFILDWLDWRFLITWSRERGAAREAERQIAAKKQRNKNALFIDVLLF